MCLTVVDKGQDWFAVDVSAETISKTASDHWQEGAKLNLERALRLGDELGGHIVTGHVDAVAEVTQSSTEGNSIRLRLSAPIGLAPMIAPKGSITLDGVSLTVNDVGETGADRAFISTLTSSRTPRATRRSAAQGADDSSMSKSMSLLDILIG